MAKRPSLAAVAGGADAADDFVSGAPRPAGTVADKPKLSRVSLDVEPELHRRIKVAAAGEGLSIRDWFLRLAARELDQ